MNNIFHYYIAAIAVYLLCLFIMRGKGFLRRKNKIMFVVILNLLVSSTASLLGDYQLYTFLGISRNTMVTYVMETIYHFLHSLLPYIFVLFAFEIAGLWDKVSNLKKAIISSERRSVFVTREYEIALSFLIASAYSMICLITEKLRSGSPP